MRQKIGIEYRRVCEFGENIAWNATKREELSLKQRFRTAGQYEKTICNGAGIWPRARYADSVVGAGRRRRWKFSWWLCWGRNWWIYGTGSECSLIGPIAESLEPQHRSSI